MSAVSPRRADAVIVVPGLMGSELIDGETGEMLWGLADPRWWVSVWSTGTSLNRLAVTEAERSGRQGRIRPGGLLSVPAVVPFFHGFQPYNTLLSKLRGACGHDEAVTSFPYDWRLPVAFNAARLADVAGEHLRAWRRHRDGNPDARLVIVAHSMGGLVARHFVEHLGGAPDVRALLALGTPFYGSVKAAVILNAGRGAAAVAPRRRLRRLARTLPGIYDLLPTYRCVDEGTHVRRLEAADVARLGGDLDLAAAALDRPLPPEPPPMLRVAVGVDQPTIQSLALHNGTATPLYHTVEIDSDGRRVTIDHGGDDTVARPSATGFCHSPSYWSQRHSALARMDEIITHARSVATETRLGPELGPELLLPGIGVHVPDLVAADADFDLTVPTVDDPSAVRCRVVDAFNDTPVARPSFGRHDGLVTATIHLPRPGVYRVEVKGGGHSPVSALVLALPPDQLALEEDDAD